VVQRGLAGGLLTLMAELSLLTKTSSGQGRWERLGVVLCYLRLEFELNMRDEHEQVAAFDSASIEYLLVAPPEAGALSVVPISSFLRSRVTYLELPMKLLICPQSSHVQTPRSITSPPTTTASSSFSHRSQWHDQPYLGCI